MEKINALVNWNNISIFKKVGLGAGIVILFLAGISFQSVSGISGIVDDTKEVVYGNQLDGILAQKEVDHLTWANRISNLLNGEDPAALKIHTDHKTCSLGKWLYSEERAQAEALVPGLVPLLKKIEGPHQEMHDSAQRIKETYKKGHNGLDITLTDFQTAHAAWVSKLGEAIAEEAGGLYDYQNRIKSAVQQAVSLVKAIDGVNGLSQSEKQARAYQSLKGMRYGDEGQGYFFVLDDGYAMVMHPLNPAMEGQNLQLEVDRTGKLFFSEMVHMAQDNTNGFVTYYWPVPGTGELSPKLSFVTLYEPWNWVIVTGTHVDHTNAKLLRRVEGFAVEEPFELGLELDPAASAFGQFTSSPETLAIMEAFPAFKAAMEAAQTPFEQLYKHGAQIEAAITRLDMTTAINIFQNQVRQDLDAFHRALATAIDAERAFTDTRQEAEAIYTGTTMPALGKVRDLLHEIRAMARKEIKTDDAILAGPSLSGPGCLASALLP